jgi:hypothetical protein
MHARSGSRIAIFASVIACAGFGVAIYLHYADAPSGRASPKPEILGAERAIAAGSMRPSTMAAPSSSAGDANNLHDPQIGTDANERSAKQVPKILATRDSAPVPANGARSTDPLDQTVVGRPFPISASIDLLCGKGNGGRELDCENTRRLAEFAQEPRDTKWALNAEDGLRILVDRASKKTGASYQIRNLECRLDTCVIEVDSYHQPLNERLLANDWRTFHVAPFDENWGFEMDDRGREVKVTLWIYGRWPE